MGRRAGSGPLSRAWSSPPTSGGSFSDERPHERPCLDPLTLLLGNAQLRTPRTLGPRAVERAWPGSILIVRSLSNPPVSVHNSRNRSPRATPSEIARLQAFRRQMPDPRVAEETAPNGYPSPQAWRDPPPRRGGPACRTGAPPGFEPSPSADRERRAAASSLTREVAGSTPAAPIRKAPARACGACRRRPPHRRRAEGTTD